MFTLEADIAGGGLNPIDNKNLHVQIVWYSFYLEVSMNREYYFYLQYLFDI